ncbi:hypothetical protein C1H46_034976 [Malus baccata]|uniref:Uncharacterized protein n=1 Tax=Malus baccata TaxID=106549 RepID=A0A540KZ08_MALBA|nr:hypothetical protein C1H46_034976 [Malus baccata]
MVANSLTSLLNLEIEFKIFLQEDGITIASILLFLVYGMHFNEQWKSRTTPYVTVPEQHCVSHHVFSYVIGKRWILVELELHHKKTGKCIRMLTFGSEEICLTVSVSWQNELFKFLELDTTHPPYVFKCQLYTLTEVMKDMVEALGLLRSSKSSMYNIGVAYDVLKFNDFNDSERMAVFNILYRLVPSISLFQKMEFYDNQTLGGPGITEKGYEMCFLEGKMIEKDITPMVASLTVVW